MSAEKKAHLIFIPLPILSHLVPAVKAAELLAEREESLSITVLILRMPNDTKISSYTKNSPQSRINLVHLPKTDPSSLEEMMTKYPENAILRLIENQRGPAKNAVSKLMTDGPSKLAGIVIDIFCSPMIDVADELGAANYVFFPFGAASVGLVLHFQSLRDDHSQDLSKYLDSEAVISIPTYANLVPARVLPDGILEGGFLDILRRLKSHAKGIMVNTFLEFEPRAIESLSNDPKIPPVYPIGPLIEVGGGGEFDSNKRNKCYIMEWLDEQPDSSVVFLCFGSIGWFNMNQVREIALALERSGHRFLWSLRKPPPNELEFPEEYDNLGEALPEGFLDRTAMKGKVIGWAPQMAVLSHRSVGGFVTHCGWNSTLESLWCGVPMAAWPLACDQQLNAFQLVRELGMAIEIKMDYRKNDNVIVAAEKIERAIEQLMDPKNKCLEKVKVLREKSRKAMSKGVSSYDSVGHLVVDIMGNIS